MIPKKSGEVHKRARQKRARQIPEAVPATGDRTEQGPGAVTARSPFDFDASPQTRAGAARSSDRLNLRVQPAVKDLLEQGAALKGLTLTDYITATMVETARQDIATAMRRRLSAGDTALLLEMLQEEGQEPTDRMRQAAERYNRLVSGATR